MLSAADKMPQINFEPMFDEAMFEIHSLVQELPEPFKQQQPQLISTLSQDYLHFGWSQALDRLNELLQPRSRD